MISCLSGYDDVFIIGKTCLVACHTGYEVQGGDAIRTCNSEGRWTGNKPMCIRNQGNFFLSFYILAIPIGSYAVQALTECLLHDPKK